MDKMESVFNILPESIRDFVSDATIQKEHLQEIRMRMGKPLQIKYQNQIYFYDKEGVWKKIPQNAFLVTEQILKTTLEYLSEYSVYAFQEELKQGFLTIQGGHRVGVTGKVILNEGKIRGMKYISSFNIRIAHEKKGCANQIVPYLFEQMHLQNTLILSPPGCGKTTLLRDFIRKLSNGGYQISVVDERSEIGACYMGIPQNDLGRQTDIMDACPKAEGIMMLVRSMSPQVIAVDEIGGKQDVEAILYGLRCGCNIIATVHGNSYEELRKKPWVKDLVEEGAFKRILVLQGVGQVEKICDERGEILCGPFALS